MIPIPQIALITSFNSAYTSVMPLVILALLIDSVIIVIWYYLGVALNNSSIKGTAIGEFYQLIGTAIMVAVVIGTLVLLSSVFYSTFSATKLLSPTTVSNLCTNIESSTGLDIIGKTNSLLSGPSGNSGNFPGVCTLANPTGSANITQKLDYPLASVAVIVANLTNQTVTNLNDSFTIDAWLGFLSKLQVDTGLCFDVPPVTEKCDVPIPGAPPLFQLEFQYTPYAGYNLLYDNLGVLGATLNFAVESFIAQLLMITVFLYIWPYLLFSGFVFRSTIFTRKLGGLLIAIAIAGLVIYPAVFSFEYLSLGNGLQVGTNTGNPNGINTTYGFNAITMIPGLKSGNVNMPNTTNGKSMNGNYVLNFFVTPRIKNIATYYNCWPGTVSVGGTPLAVHGLLANEVSDIGYLLLPGASVISGLTFIVTLISGSASPLFLLPGVCLPSNALHTFFALINVYGIIGMDAYFIPLMNIIITLSSIVGLSGLFGGDTSLLGLSKLI